MSLVPVSRLVVTLLIAALAAACGGDPQARKLAYVANGDRYFAEAKYAEAIVEYRNAVETDNSFGDARLKLARAYAAAGDLQRAAREHIRAADLLPNHVEAQLEAAKFLLAGAQFEDAVSRVQRVLDRDPQNVTAHVLRGTALAGLQDMEGAVRQVEEAIALDPERSATHTNLAVLKLAQGKQDEARGAFERAVLLEPTSVPALFALGMFQWGVGELATAEATLKKALAVDPRFVDGHRMLAALYVSGRRAADAEPHVKAIADLLATPAATFALADYYRTLGRRGDARRVLETMDGEGAAWSGVHSRRAQLAYDEGEAARAHALIDEVLEREPTNPPALLLKARWLLQDRKPAEALLRATAAVKAQPESAEAHYVLGVVQAAGGDKDASAQSFRQVLRINPTATVAQLQLSRLELARGDADEAVKLADGVLKTAPGNPDARLSVARGLIARLELGRAEGVVRELLGEYPAVAAVHAADGALRLAMKDAASARDSFTRALELDPRSIEALSGLTTLDIQQKRTAEARGRLQARLAQEPDRPELLTLSARLSVAEGDVPGAERTLRRIIELTPADSDAYELLARVYLAQRKLDQAKAEFDALARRRPRDISSRTMAAMIVHAQNDTADARGRYEAILALDPAAAVAANNLAWIYAAERRDLDRALRLAQTATRLMPDSAQAHDTLGWIYYQMELPALGIPPLERSVGLDPTSAEHLYHLGFAQAKGGDEAKARAALERALKMQPQGADADTARTLLPTLRR